VKGIFLTQDTQEDVDKRKASVAMLSVISNTTLVLLKLIVGLAIGSVSVISEAIHSGVDLLAAIIALFAVKTSGKPADLHHPFGHGKVENISGTVEALLIFLAAGWIIYEAAKKLMNP
jgi:cation diffusion facilitator family transporter